MGLNERKKYNTYPVVEEIRDDALLLAYDPVLGDVNIKKDDFTQAVADAAASDATTKANAAQVAATTAAASDATTKANAAQAAAVSAAESSIINRGRLARNSGANYPLKQMTRGGITSAANTYWLNCLLEVRVIGARKDEYYQIAYLQNEATLDGEAKFDWIIHKFDKATFATVGTATIIVGYQSSVYGAQEQLVRDGSTQTISLYPISRPEMRFDITVDTSKLPNAGTVINSYANNTYTSWSWIIDPACYVYRTSVDSLLVNQASAYPNRQTSRNGAISGSNDFLMYAVLDIKVKGALEGFYYGIRYFKNGSTALSGYLDGWIIEEQAIATYNTTFDSTRIMTYTDYAPDILRSGIQTIRLLPPDRPGMEIYITLDTSKLPTYGTYVSMLAEGAVGSSWVIDPSCYEYSNAVSNVISDTVSYSSDSAGSMELIWQSGDLLYRLHFGPNGYNGLPNIKGIDSASLGDRATVVWTQINTASTDWLPPMGIEAVNDGDGKALIYTGGNHGADGGAGGGNTARNILYRISVDGQPMEVGAGFSGDAKKVSAIIVNELMACNTTGTVDAINFPSRYVLRQTFVVDFHPGSVEVRAEVHAYEPITVKTDNGPQMVTTGFQGTLLYAGGQYENRIAFDSATNSGESTAFPDCWATVLQSSAGQQVSWMDREFEAGDGRYVGSTAPFARGGGASNTKFYHAVVASPGTCSMATGQKYKWRGGYAWQAPDLQGDFDSTITFHKAGLQSAAVIESASNFTVL